MSVQVMSAIYGRRLGGAQKKLIALKLADCANDDGTSVRPSIKRVASECEVSESTARRVIQSLVGDKILVLVKQGGKGPKSTTEYKFDLAKVAALELTWKGVSTTPLEENKGVNEPEEGCQNDPVRVSSSDTRPVTIDPSLLDSSLRAEAREGEFLNSNPKKGKAMLNVSSEAMAEARQLAKGWDMHFMLSEFRGMNEGNIVTDPDKAFIAFCRHRGPHPTFRACPSKGKKLPPVQPVPPGHLIITSQGKEWQWWIDHLDKTDRPLADRMRGEFMAYVPQRRPADGMAPCFPAKRAA